MQFAAGWQSKQVTSSYWCNNFQDTRGAVLQIQNNNKNNQNYIQIFCRSASILPTGWSEREKIPITVLILSDSLVYAYSVLLSFTSKQYFLPNTPYFYPRLILPLPPAFLEQPETTQLTAGPTWCLSRYNSSSTRQHISWRAVGHHIVFHRVRAISVVSSSCTQGTWQLLKEIWRVFEVAHCRTVSLNVL